MNTCFCIAETVSRDRLSLTEVLERARKHIDPRQLQSYHRPGHPDPEYQGSVFQLLVQIIISQRATLENEIKAAKALFAEYSTPEPIYQADTHEIAGLISPAGMQTGKATAIQAVAEAWQRETNPVEDIVARMDTPSAREYLMRFPRVGRKTADCLLELGFGRLVLPIETNIRQLCDVLGYRYTRPTDEELQEFLESQLPANNKSYVEAHAVLLGAGQRICRTAKPRCDQCVLCT